MELVNLKEQCFTQC